MVGRKIRSTYIRLNYFEFYFTMSPYFCNFETSLEIDLDMSLKFMIGIFDVQVVFLLLLSQYISIW